MEQSQSQVGQTLNSQKTTQREIHEYPKNNVEGDSVLSRYQRTKEAFESLKMRLAAEREQLALERFQTSSLYAIASNTNFNYALPYSYSAPANYTNTESSSENTPENANKDQKETQTSEVKEHLKKIEKICDEELGRMEKSIANLRKVRRFWNNLDFYRPYSVYSARDYRYTENTENLERRQPQKKISVASFNRGGSRNGRRHPKRPISGDDVSDERGQYVETCKQHLKVLEQTKFMIE